MGIKARRRAGSDISPTAWAWLTGQLVDAIGGDTEYWHALQCDRASEINVFELLGYVYPTHTPTLQKEWAVARESVLAYWQREGRPMPATLLDRLEKVLTPEDRALLGG